MKKGNHSLMCSRKTQKSSNISTVLVFTTLLVITFAADRQTRYKPRINRQIR